jgi:hypothetical protein
MTASFLSTARHGNHRAKARWIDTPSRWDLCYYTCTINPGLKPRAINTPSRWDFLHAIFNFQFSTTFNPCYRGAGGLVDLDLDAGVGGFCYIRVDFR